MRSRWAAMKAIRIRIAPAIWIVCSMPPSVGEVGRAPMLTRSVSFYITTPIYYVNAEPHLGHAYSTIGADIVARHMRQRGEDVFFLTGTDEHGEPVELAAEREGVSPQELADRHAPRFQAMAASVNATNDFFIRTSDTRHTDRVAAIMAPV